MFPNNPSERLPIKENTTSCSKVKNLGAFTQPHLAPGSGKARNRKLRYFLFLIELIVSRPIQEMLEIQNTLWRYKLDSKIMNLCYLLSKILTFSRSWIVKRGQSQSIRGISMEWLLYFIQRGQELGKRHRSVFNSPFMTRKQWSTNDFQALIKCSTALKPSELFFDENNNGENMIIVAVRNNHSEYLAVGSL